MQYKKSNLPEEVKVYLREIIRSEALTDAFYDCDIEIYDEDQVQEFEEDEELLLELTGPGEFTYKSIKPFAGDGSGALWVVVDDSRIGYIGTEGECGIVARNIHEFMNIASAWGGYLADYWHEEVLASREAFYNTMNDPDRLEDYDGWKEQEKVFKKFREKHGFTKEIYEMAVAGITVTPFFIIKATDDEYVDTNALISNQDGQESLEKLIKRLGNN